MSKSKLTKLRGELAKVEKGRGKRYPERLRGEATRYARERRAEGASYGCIGRELGLGLETVRRWCLRATGESATGAALVPIEVVPEPTDDGLVLVSPSGFRLEGLELREAIAALGALS